MKTSTLCSWPRRRSWPQKCLPWLATLAFVFIVLALVMSLVGCSNPSSRTNSHSRADFTGKSEEQLVTAEIKPDMNKHELHLQVHLKSGACSWTLRDPQGEIQWQDGISGKKNFNQKRDLPLVAGEWRLTILLEDATGSYDIKWNGKD